MEETQGIMSLPQPTGIDPEQFAVFEDMRSQIPPAEFGNTLLESASEADPEAVAAFREALSSVQIPMDALELLNEMVDAVLKSPGDYASLRRYYMTRGLTEDVLPEQFDPLFFSALNLALDQITPQSEPMAMAAGGLASLAQYGRFGDTILAHITPEEAALLRARGGSGTINPVTGLPEFFLSKIFKSIGNAIKGFTKSTVGRIITTIALGYFLGPAVTSFLGATGTTAAAITGFVGGAGTSLLAGEDFKNALMAGAKGGLTAGILSAAGILPDVTGRAEAAPAPSADVAATELVVEGSPNLDPSEIGTRSVFDARNRGPSPESNPVRVPDISTRNPITGQEVRPQTPQTASGTSPQPSVKLDYMSGNIYNPVTGDTLGMPQTASNVLTGDVNQLYGPSQGLSSTPAIRKVSVLETPSSYSLVSPDSSSQFGFNPNAEKFGFQVPTTSNFSANPDLGRALEFKPPSPDKRGIMELLEQGEYAKAGKKVYDQFMPESLGGQRGIATPDAINDKMAQATQNVKVKNPDLAVKALSSINHKQVFDDLVRAEATRLATPGILSTYGPLALAATGVAAAAGAFKTKPAERPNFSKLDFANYYRGLGPFTLAPSPPFIPVRTVKEGGIMSLEMEGIKFPKKQGSINGPGTGTSDSIPALLSDGEFVFTAKAVRGMGHGSRRRGAKRLYSLMKMLEERKG